MAHSKRTRRLLFIAFGVLILLALLYIFFSSADEVEDAEQGTEQPTTAPSGESSSRRFPAEPVAVRVRLRLLPPAA